MTSPGRVAESAPRASFTAGVLIDGEYLRPGAPVGRGLDGGNWGHLRRTAP